MNSPFDIKQAKEYFKKNEFEVPSNLEKQKIDPAALYEVENCENDAQQERIEQLNAFAHDYPAHNIVSFLASVNVSQDEPLSTPKIYSMICSSKAPTELLQKPNFEIGEVIDDKLDVGLFFQVKPLFAQLLNFISRNFTYLIGDPEIKYMSKDDFKLLLKHKYLNVTQEDEVVKAICLWSEGQGLMIQKDGDRSNLANPTNRLAWVETSTLQQDLDEILSNVNWDFVSLPCLLDVIRNDPTIR